MGHTLSTTGSVASILQVLCILIRGTLPLTVPAKQAGDYTPWSPAPITYHHEPQDDMHYVPPSAISTRYYALSNPNAYPAEPLVHPAIHPENALLAEVTAAGGATTSQPAVTAEVAPRISPSLTPASNAHVDPILPKQRSNGDDPGGELRLLAQPMTQHEVGPALLRLGQNHR